MHRRIAARGVNGSTMINLLAGETPHRFTCSAAGCTAEATVALRWQNPKIHRGDRYKTWLSCGIHRDSLYSFLADRNFAISVIGVDEL